MKIVIIGLNLSIYDFSNYKLNIYWDCFHYNTLKVNEGDCFSLRLLVASLKGSLGEKFFFINNYNNPFPEVCKQV